MRKVGVERLVDRGEGRGKREMGGERYLRDMDKKREKAEMKGKIGTLGLVAKNGSGCLGAIMNGQKRKKKEGAFRALEGWEERSKEHLDFRVQKHSK